MKKAMMLVLVLGLVAGVVFAEKVTLTYKAAKLAAFYKAVTNNPEIYFGPRADFSTMTNSEAVLQKLVARMIANAITRADEIAANKAKPVVVPTEPGDVE